MAGRSQQGKTARVAPYKHTLRVRRDKRQSAEPGSPRRGALRCIAECGVLPGNSRVDGTWREIHVVVVGPGETTDG